MNTAVQHEKYISIEYETWLNKYKPLEEENEQLRQELENSSVRVRISLSQDWIDFTTIGYVDINVSAGYNINIENRRELEDAISTEIHKIESYRKYFNREEAKDYLKKVEFNKTEYAKLVIENKNRIKNIPFFLKWIFKIKEL